MESKKLFHKSTESLEDFFVRVDSCGGFPHNAKSVIMKHDDDRTCYFSAASHEIRDGWNTTIAFADEYYLWKKLKEELLRELKVKISNIVV